MNGVETRMGIKLYSTFVAAGLPAPAMRLGSLFGGGANSSDQAHMVADLANTLLPEMERLGVTTAGEVGYETLAERMVNEAITTNSIIIGRLQVGAWSHV